MDFSPANLTALVVAASFAAGLNVYATILTLGLLARTHWVALPPGLDSLGQTWVIAVCAILFGVEFIADKIPGIDLIWNALHTLIRIPLAALVAYHASAQLTPQMQVLTTVLGAAIALAAHTSKTALRAVVTPSPEPVSNIGLSAIEDAIAVGLTWFATHHPILGGAIALIFVAGAIAATRALLHSTQRLLRHLFGGRPTSAETAPELPLADRR